MADRRVILPDLGLTALLVVVGLFGTGPAATNQGQTAPSLSYVLVVAAGLPIALRRWRPLWTFVLTGSATMLYLGLGYAYGPILFSLIVAVYTLAVRSSVRVVATATAGLLLAAVVAVGAQLVAGQRQWFEFFEVSAWLVFPAAVGVAVKTRRDATASVRAEQARRAVSEERLELTQEVHDVVGHGLAVIAMQAGVALRVLDRDPAKVRESLEAIRSTSREALDGLRAELDAWRQGAPRADVPLRPDRGLADLPGLVERIRSTGLPLAVEVTGAPDLPSGVDRVAYRIAQESLTNVMRHAGPGATARVRVWQEDATLVVEVVDTGTGTTGYGIPEGHGVHGMRERAEALGGTLDAGPVPGGGFAVRARLPVQA
jgi:signal transduction histidine kinase